MKVMLRIIVVGTVLTNATGCVQLVHVRTAQREQQLVLDKKKIGIVPVEGALVSVERGMKEVSFELYNNDKLSLSGQLKRDRINAPIFAASIASAVILAPVLAVIGVFVVNPSWLYMDESSVAGVRAYTTQTASPYTIPVASLFGTIGLLPLLGLLKAGELPNSVAIPFEWGLQ